MDTHDKPVTKYAGLISRLISAIIDFFLLYAGNRFLDKILPIDWSMTVPVFLLDWLYFSSTVFWFSGTVGQKIVGLKVFTCDLDPVSFSKATIRGLIITIEIILIFAGYTFVPSLLRETPILLQIFGS